MFSMKRISDQECRGR